MTDGKPKTALWYQQSLERTLLQGKQDHEIILAIQEMLDGTVWEISMLSEIADLLTDNGYAVADRK